MNGTKLLLVTNIFINHLNGEHTLNIVLERFDITYSVITKMELLGFPKS